VRERGASVSNCQRGPDIGGTEKFNGPGMCWSVENPRPDSGRELARTDRTKNTVVDLGVLTGGTQVLVGIPVLLVNEW
jgi:hypothetical protein